MPNEAKTRKEIIDGQLEEAGWQLDDRTQVVEEYSIVASKHDLKEPATTYQTTEFSDYILLGKDGKPLAVVEAKKSTSDAENGREQAKQYCYHIQQESGGELPFCFYTNGLEIFFWDLENYPPKKVLGYPSRADLERLQYIRKHRKPLAAELINPAIAGRDYQMQAIRAVTEVIEKKQTKFLLVMATGTGKTRTSIALVDTLLRASWASRVLFLVDRIALRTQALDAFKEHLPHEPRWPKEGEKSIATDRRIYVSTYPTMLNIVRDEEFGLSPHFFDLIIVDESHRSIYNTYKEVLDHFNTITLGLTATPTDVIDHNTFQLFHCEDGLPTFAFSYEEAIYNEPPYLCDFEVLKISTKFQNEGIHKRSITLADQKQLIHDGKEVEEINYEGEELEKTVINKGTNVAIVKAFMEDCIKDPNGVLPGKTIFFCATKSHARRVEKIFDALYPEYAGELAKTIVSEDARVHGKDGLISQFRYNSMPRVAISVDMLDTGIDVLEIVNLVFAKPVYSYTKFWQMIGRGTRLLDPHKRKEWCLEKDVFRIMDCWDNFAYFEVEAKGRELKAQTPLPVRYVDVILRKIRKAQDKQEPDIAQKEAERLRQLILELPAQSVVIKEAAVVLSPVQVDTFWQQLSSEQLDYLEQHIKPLFRTVSQKDFKAMRFRKDVLETSLVHLVKDEKGQEEKFEALKADVVDQVSALPTTISLVATHEAFIRKLHTASFWQSITDSQFDEIAAAFAPLMKLRDYTRPLEGPERFNLHDELQTREWVEFGPEREAVSITRYREMVEAKINALTQNHPLLQRLQAGQELNATEAEALAAQLEQEDPHITEALLRKVYQHRQADFVQFIKHILGIEQLERFDTQVSQTVNQFIAQYPDLSRQQLEFINLLKSYIIEKGSVDKKNLIEAPFTIIHSKGVLGLFSPAQLKSIIDLTDQFAA